MVLYVPELATPIHNSFIKIMNNDSTIRRWIQHHKVTSHFSFFDFAYKKFLLQLRQDFYMNLI